MLARPHRFASDAALLLAWFLSAPTLVHQAAAQHQGAWLDSFDHEHSGTNATPYLFPGSSLAGATWEYQPAGVFGWGDWADVNQPQIAGKFNAIHMALIPKGPYRGHLLVWNRYPVYVDVGPVYSQSADRYWACQAWSIVNPAKGAPAPRFRNFLLPMTPAGNTPPSLGIIVVGANLFCAGHAWSPAGELVVAGGDHFTFVPGVGGYAQAVGARWLYLFDPSQASAPFPAGGATTSLYPGEFGAWVRPIIQGEPLELSKDRYYPTVMLTHRLGRLGGQLETMLVFGGSVPPNMISNPGPGGDDPQNTYESYIVRANGSPSPFLEQDLSGGATVPVYRGPGTTAMSHLDWFLEYPRPTLLGDGNVFLSGWVANGVRWDPEMPYPASAAFPPPTGTFDYSTGQAWTSTVWGLPRHYGSTVFMARYGALQDVVLRLGGEDGGTATETSEICLATQTGAPWISLGDVTGDTTGRTHGNAVVLPDGSVLAVGGNEVGGPAELILARYTPASGWVEANKLPTPRDYHATALLLPDGAVMIGGGDGRFLNVTGTSHDYDVYHPWYMVGQKRPENVVLTNVPTAPDGTYLLVPNQTGVVLQAQMNGIASLDRVVLTAPGSVTHHFDMSARYIELASTSGGPGSRTFQVPAETVAPRGYYLLWAVDNSGVPSKAIWVRIQ